MSHPTQRTPGQRPLRVGEELRHALAMIFERGDVHDPVLGRYSLTVSEVRMSPDLRRAEVFLLPLGGGDGEGVLAALGRAKGFLKRRVAERVRLKYMPDFVFRLDSSFERACRIAELIERTRAADAARRNDSPADDDGPRGGSDGERGA
jgi:ribosome-binding factor A